MRDRSNAVRLKHFIDFIAFPGNRRILIQTMYFPAGTIEDCQITFRVTCNDAILYVFQYGIQHFSLAFHCLARFNLFCHQHGRGDHTQYFTVLGFPGAGLPPKILNCAIRHPYRIFRIARCLPGHGIVESSAPGRTHGQHVTDAGRTAFGVHRGHESAPAVTRCHIIALQIQQRDTGRNVLYECTYLALGFRYLVLCLNATFNFGLHISCDAAHLQLFDHNTGQRSQMSALFLGEFGPWPGVEYAYCTQSMAIIGNKRGTTIEPQSHLAGDKWMFCIARIQSRIPNT